MLSVRPKYEKVASAIRNSAISPTGLRAVFEARGEMRLIDGGSVTAPHFAFYTPEGEWQIENYGVEPDIEVDLDPKAVRQGKDPQLERAVEWLIEELRKNPPPKPTRPPYPNYQSSPHTGSNP